MKKIAIIGAGDLGQHIAHYINNSQDYQLVGFFDDFQEKGINKAGLKVLGKTTDIEIVYKKGEFDEVLVGIGYNYMTFRKEVFDKLSGTIPFATYIHPASYIDQSAEIGEGSFILPGCVIDKKVHIGKNVFLNIHSAIAHDSIIGSNSILAPSVAIAGFSEVGESCFLGISTTISDHITICNHVKTGAGTTIIDHIHESGLYICTPSRKIKDSHDIF